MRDSLAFFSEYEYDKTILNAYLEVSTKMSKIKNLNQYYELKNQESKALEKSIDIAQLLFKNSRADYLEVLMNNRDLLDAKIELCFKSLPKSINLSGKG